MKKTSIKELFILALVTGFIAFTLAPVVARLQRDSGEAKCQSNLHRLGEAMAMYVQDNAGRFPTNRPYSGDNRALLGKIKYHIALSPPEIDPATDQPRVFDYGITWVEALYPYVWRSAGRTDQNWRSVWRCPSSSSMSDPTDPSNHCATSYVFSGYLVEGWTSLCRNQNKLMMIREFGRLTCSTLRPVYPMYSATWGDPTTPPMYAFLNDTDYGPNMKNTSALKTPHGGGSHILCADGHVKHFTVDYYPNFNTLYNRSRAWDLRSQQWWNYSRNPVTSPEYAVTIAVSP